MKALVMSDSHGNEELLREGIQFAWKKYGKIDYYLHLGDGARDFSDMESTILLPYPKALMFGVKGNCDWGMICVPEDRVLRIGNTQVFMTHGSRYAVKQGFDLLNAATIRAKCSVAIFGHTHVQHIEQRETLMVNPGSIRDRKMAIIEFLPDGTAIPELISF